jgi:type IV pilus assembly protein PilC
MGVSQKEKIFFAENLSLMIKGGIPIAESLETLRDEVKSRTFRKILADTLKRVLEGEGLAKSLERYPRVFDRFFLSVVKLGEKSGTLEENFKYLALQLRKDYELRRKVIGALLYPILIIILAILIILVVIYFVLPKIIPVFESLQAMGIVGQLPLATQILLNLGNFLRNFGFLIPPILICFFLFFKILQKISLIRFYFDKIALAFPILGNIFKNLNLARFSWNFYTLLKSGMPILEALEVCSSILPSEVYRRNLFLIKTDVERGEKISSSLKKIPQYFSPIFSEMILVGEKTGSLEESFLYLAEFYTQEADSTIKNISDLIGPILLIFIGILVILIALATIIPIFRFIGEIKVR